MVTLVNNPSLIIERLHHKLKEQGKQSEESEIVVSKCSDSIDLLCALERTYLLYFLCRQDTVAPKIPKILADSRCIVISVDSHAMQNHTHRNKAESYSTKMFAGWNYRGCGRNWCRAGGSNYSGTG